MSFICGFSGNQDDDLEDLCILQSTPQKKLTRKRPSFGRSKNPYSNRGLDKFEALLADLNGKRQMIYTKKGSEDISLVRFTYPNSNDVVPVVVKVKNPRKQDKDHNNKVVKLLSSPEHPVAAGGGGDAVVQLAKPPVGGDKSVGNFDQLRRKFGEWWRPEYSLPILVMWILVFLVFSGRFFAIFCACIGWYMVPADNGRLDIVKRPRKVAGKKEYSRKLGEKMVVNSVYMMNTQPHRRSF